MYAMCIINSTIQIRVQIQHWTIDRSIKVSRFILHQRSSLYRFHRPCFSNSINTLSTGPLPLVLSDSLTCRQVLNIMVILGFMLNYMLRVNMTIAIVSMVMPSNHTSTHSDSNNRTGECFDRRTAANVTTSFDDDGSTSTAATHVRSLRRYLSLVSSSRLRSKFEVSAFLLLRKRPTGQNTRGTSIRSIWCWVASFGAMCAPNYQVDAWLK